MGKRLNRNGGNGLGVAEGQRPPLQVQSTACNLQRALSRRCAQGPTLTDMPWTVWPPTSLRLVSCPPSRSGFPERTL